MRALSQIWNPHLKSTWKPVLRGVTWHDQGDGVNDKLQSGLSNSALRQAVDLDGACWPFSSLGVERGPQVLILPGSVPLLSHAPFPQVFTGSEPQRLEYPVLH